MVSNVYQGQLFASRRFHDDVTVTATVPARDHIYRPTSNTYHLTGTAAGELAGSYTYNTAYNPDDTVQYTTMPAAGGLPGAVINYTYDELRRPINVTGDVALASQVVYYPTGLLAQVGLVAGAKRSLQSFEYERGTNRLTRAFMPPLRPLPFTAAAMSSGCTAGRVR